MGDTVNAVDLPELLVVDAGEWRRWLSKHYADSLGVWLVLAKKGTADPTTISYDEALDEAICFGWIDGQLGRRDAATFRRRFTPRKARSPWSQRNAAIAEKLIANGRMHRSGEDEVRQAKQDGRWEAVYAGQASIEVPEDLLAALSANPRGRRCLRCSQVRIGTPSSTGSETPRNPKPALDASASLSRCWTEVRPSTPRLHGHPSRSLLPGCPRTPSGRSQLYRPSPVVLGPQWRDGRASYCPLGMVVKVSRRTPRPPQTAPVIPA